MDKKTIAVLGLVVALGVSLGAFYRQQHRSESIGFGKCIQVHSGFYKGLKGIAMQKEGSDITFIAIKDGQMLGGIKDSESNLEACHE